jgi:hypothetical protein
MRLDELKWNSELLGSYWAEARLPGRDDVWVWRALQDGGTCGVDYEERHHAQIHLKGEYAIKCGADYDRPRYWRRLDPITAQAIIHHLLRGVTP